ncbi:MAG: hypothetical protein DCC55_12125 [Chloroflexi bacterium]|nr:MAG: hypothetical protein DCC55_12125 [Chloroflexota bacterium]
MFKSLFFRVVLAVVLLAGLAPFSTAQHIAATPSIEHVEVLRLPSGGYWGHPSPFGFNRGPGYMRASLVFDTLVWRDASGETIPWLATDWRLADDGITWTFTLREGVQWQDGEPFTADDVVFSIEYYLDNPGTAWFMSQVDQIASATKVSDTQVALTLKQPFAPFIQTTAESLLIFPQHIWENVDDPKTYTKPDAFIGTGAYRMIEYSEAEGTYLFEANPDFFLGEPYVQRIEFVPTSDNFLALINGDIAAFDKFGGVTDEMLEPFQSDPFEVRTAPGEWGMFLFFNLEQDTPLQDVRVRQALAHAVDRQAMLERILYGFGDVGSMGFLPPANPFYNPDLIDYVYDPAQAQALLAEAGYNGTPIKLFYAAGDTETARVIEIITNGLEAIGLEIERVSLDQTSLDAAAVEGSYEIGVFGFGGLGGDPDQLRRSFASQSQTRGFSRALGYNNPDFDALAGAQLSLTDPTARRDAIFEMQSILAEDLPVLPLYYTARVVVFNADVFDNWYYTPGGWGGGIPMPYNKHQFIVGLPTGLEIRE